MKTSVGRSMQSMTADNPMMQSQKFLVYLSPLFGLFGLTLPLGVLIYWVTTNSWTLAQSHYVYKKYPMPTQDGQTTAASNGKAGTTTKAGTTSKTGAKSGAKAGAKGNSGLSSTARQPSGMLGKTRKKAEPEPEDTEPATPKVVRQQPSRQSRSKRKR
jgi:YidC/Oxa1 family membrane protein insertase